MSAAHTTAPRQMIHATSVSLADHGALIVGASGQGKSSLALQLMALGASLVADDQTDVWCADGAVWAASPRPISGMVEARGVGLLCATPVTLAQMHVVIDMDNLETERLPQPHTYPVAQVQLPCLHKVDSPCFPAAIVQYLRCGRRDPS